MFKETSEGQTNFNVLDEIIGQIESLEVTDPRRESDDYEEGLREMKRWILIIVNKFK
jgi:hypothetical protein